MTNHCQKCGQSVIGQWHHSGEKGLPLCCECAHPESPCPSQVLGDAHQATPAPSSAVGKGSGHKPGEKAASVKIEGQTGHVLSLAKERRKMSRKKKLLEWAATELQSGEWKIKALENGFGLYRGNNNLVVTVASVEAAQAYAEGVKVWEAKWQKKEGTK